MIFLAVSDINVHHMELLDGTKKEMNQTKTLHH
jgi:hypothetical protein